MIRIIQSNYDKLFDATISRIPMVMKWDEINRDLPSKGRELTRADIYLAVIIGIIGMAVSIWAFAQTNRVPEIHTTFNLWLHGDIARYAENVVSTAGNHGRTSVHPLFSILLYPFGALLTTLGVDPLTAAKTLVVLVMGGNAAVFCLTARLLGLPRLGVAIFSLVFVSTASFMFWGAVVESFQFSCFSVLLSLFMMLRVKEAHWGWWVLVNVLALGFLITNWMFALIAMAVRLKLKQFVAIAAGSFALVVALSVVQNATFERAALFFNPQTLLRETHYLQPVMEADGTSEDGFQPVSNLRSFYVTTVVAMPVYAQQIMRMRIATSNQRSSFPEGEIVPVIAVVTWVVLFGMGIWGVVKRREFYLPVLGIGTLLALQTGLHLVYGEVTFLYNMNFMPLLVLVASMSWFAPYRQIALAMAACVIVFGGINNERRVQHTVDVAGCLSQLDVVQQTQTWEVIRSKRPGPVEHIPELYVDTTDICGTKSPS